MIEKAEDQIDDVLSFLAAIDLAHRPPPKPRPTLPILVQYSLGTMPAEEAAALEEEAVADSMLSTRLFEVWKVVRDLNANQLASASATPDQNPFQAEVAHIWRLQSLKAATVPVKRDDRDVIGRDEDIQSLQRLLAEFGRGPLIITGTGGVGKTTVLRKLATGEGGHFIDCAGISSAEDFYAALARTLEIEPGDDVPNETAAFLVEKKILLLLDRLDGLEFLGPEFAFLLGKAPDLRICGTSRSSLGFPDERNYTLEPLSVAEEDQASAAEGLFWSLIKRVVVDLKANTANHRLVRELCQLTMGVPLSISIAAGCLHKQSLPELVENLRLPRASAEALQNQPVQASIAQSFFLLSHQDRTLLHQLGVFAGSFSYEDAQYVCEMADLGFSDSLAHLQRCGLAEAEVGADGITYRIHDSVLESFGELALESLLPSQNRHAETFAFKAERVGELMKEGRWGAGIQSLRGHNANLRRALRHSIQQQNELQIRQFADGLARTYFESGFLTDFELTSTAAIALGDKPLSIRMLGLQGALASLQGDEAKCMDLWKKRLELCLELNNVVDAADTLNDLASQAFDLGDTESANVYLEEGERLATEAQAWEIVASSYVVRTRLLLKSDDLESVSHWCETTEAILPKCRDKILLPFVYQGLARAYMAMNEQDKAIHVLRQLLQLASEGHRSIHVARTLLHLAPLYEAKGEVETALGCYTSAVSVLNEYTTKDRKKAEQDLESFCLRHGISMESALLATRNAPWDVFVSSLL